MHENRRFLNWFFLIPLILVFINIAISLNSPPHETASTHGDKAVSEKDSHGDEKKADKTDHDEEKPVKEAETGH